MQQGNDNYRLVVRRGPQPNQVYELNKDVLNLGRDITNDIVINDREVSRHHLRIVRGTEGFTIEDLGSTNGTFVNGKRLSGAIALKNGDMVGLGETVTLGYELLRPAGAGAPAQPQQPQQQPQSAQPQQQPADAAQPANPYQPQQPQPEGYQQQPASYQPQPEAENPYQPQQGGYQQQPAAYGGDPAYAQQGYYPPQPGYGPPPQAPPGYDYDPYAVREEEGGRSTQWLLIGCALFLVISCLCVSVIGLVVIDTLNLWCEFPVVKDIVTSLGYCQVIIAP